MAGNLMLARRYPGFVSALATLLAAADATLHVVQAQGELPPSSAQTSSQRGAAVHTEFIHVPR